MICRAIPALWDLQFRRSFYERWGHESAVISARTRRVEYPDFKQCCRSKRGPAENYFIDGRCITVDDDTFAIFNHDRVYASHFESLRPLHSFSIFFDRKIAAQTWHLLSRSVTALEDGAEAKFKTGEFAERLYEHESMVSPVLRQIRAAVDAGPVDDVWLEEQLSFLLSRILREGLPKNRSAVGLILWTLRVMSA